MAFKRAQKLPDALKCQKMPVRAWEARKTLTDALRRSGAPIPLTRGFQVARNRASPCKAYLHGTDSHLVGRWSQTVDVAAMGGWGSPQTVSGCAQGAAGTVAALVVKGERVSKRFSRQGMTELNRWNEEEPRSKLL